MKLRKMIAPLFMALLAIGFFAGCSSTAPIKTTLDIEATDTGMPVLNYSSEKDVLYSRTFTDPDTGIVEQVDFKALASAAALAQAERERVQAEASKAQAEALSAAIQALSGDAASVLEAPPSPPAE